MPAVVDNWEELLEQAEASYPPRAGPRRNKQKERSKNRLYVMYKQHKVTKYQLRAARAKKRVSVTQAPTSSSRTLPLVSSRKPHHLPTRRCHPSTGKNPEGAGQTAGGLQRFRLRAGERVRGGHGGLQECGACRPCEPRLFFDQMFVMKPPIPAASNAAE